MWNHRVYGDPLPQTSPPVGTYHAVRSPAGAWSKAQLSPLGIAGFHQYKDSLQVISQVYGKLHTQTWDYKAGVWSEAVPLIGDEVAPVSAGFIDVLNSSSGSVISEFPVLVTDGLLPAVPETAQQRLLWSYGLEYAF